MAQETLLLSPFVSTKCFLRNQHPHFYKKNIKYVTYAKGKRLTKTRNGKAKEEIYMVFVWKKK
jgi:hypothetical protein